MDEKPILYLLDASAYIYRAFYAIPTLTTTQGIPTNAIYGFIKMLFKIIRQANPKYMAIAYDVKGHTFRHHLYPAYKSNRPSLSPELKIQLPLIRQLVTALELPAIEIEGLEADDLIATLTRQALKENFKIIIISSDKDFFQLVQNNHVIIWDTIKEIKLGPNEIQKKLNVRPELVVDYMALTGDKTDNIPGVPGIGPKRAAQLLATYKSLDNLLEIANYHKKNKIWKYLINNRELILLSRKLIRLNDNAPILFQSENFKIYEPDLAVLTPILTKLELTNFIKQLTHNSIYQQVI